MKGKNTKENHEGTYANKWVEKWGNILGGVKYEKRSLVCAKQHF